jgi:hypothetical protein
MRFGIRTTIVGGAAVALLSTGCQAGGGGLVKQYEYEEDIYLNLDGSATVYVNASIPALVSLRGLPLDTKPNARLDRGRVRSLFSTPVSDVVRVSTWRRFGRRFVQVRMAVTDIRKLSTAPPFSWATYGLAERDGLIVYQQQLAAAAGGIPGDVGWKGNEVMAIRLHLPARIRYHNAGAGNLKRGNILVWEQSLAARQAGTPLTVEARMERSRSPYSPSSSGGWGGRASGRRAECRGTRCNHGNSGGSSECADDDVGDVGRASGQVDLSHFHQEQQQSHHDHSSRNPRA